MTLSKKTRNPTKPKREVRASGRAPFRLNGNEIAAGKRATVDLPLPNQSTYTPMWMPVHVIHGRADGPVMLISAAVHGDEINGVEIIRRLLRLKVLDSLRGTLLCVPIVNVFGFLNHSRYLPDRRDLNRSFPGSEHGSLTGRVAYTFSSQILEKCSHGIDLHTGANHRTNLPHIRANLDDPETLRLAHAFGTPVMINANLRDGSLRQRADELGVKTLLYEAGQALRFDSVAIRAGVRGVVQVMRELGMLPRSRRHYRKIEPLALRSSSWVRTPESGIVRLSVRLGQQVQKGQQLGVVSDALGEREVTFKAPFGGLVIGLNLLPVVNEGDALLHLAKLDGEDENIGLLVEAFHEEHIEGLRSSDYIDPSGLP